MSRLDSKAFTIVEVLVGVVVTSLLLMVIMNFMANGLINYAVIQARRDLLIQAQQGLDQIADETRLSANADLNNRWPDNNAPSAPNNLYSWTSNASTLILATAVQDTNKNIVFSDASQYITEKNNNIYFISSGTLYKRTLASTVSNNSSKTTCPSAKVTSSCPADKKLIENISSFTVLYYDGDNNQVSPTDARSIELQVNLSKKYYGRTITADYKTRMVFRND